MMQPLVANGYVVTVEDKATEPLKSGMCLLDCLANKPDFMTKVRLTFSKPMQQLHMEAVSEDTAQESPSPRQMFSESALRRKALLNTGKTYEIALAHSDRCLHF